MPELPKGTITFLFTDIEGSTILLQQLGDRRYREVLADHNKLLRAAFAERGGQEIQTQGDAFFVAFRSAKDAVSAAVAAQAASIGHAWPENAALRVRMGLHTGEPLSAAEGYVGLGVHRAARICSAGHGGQILLSQTTRDLIEADLPSNVNLRDLGEHRLKDLQRPERVFQVLHPDLPASFPPLKSLQSAPPAGPVSGRSVADRLRRTRLVGRTDQLGRLLERLDRLSTGSSEMILVSGEPGIGKSRLLAELIAAGKAKGFQILQGRCHERDTAIPYLPISEALEGCARNLSPGKWTRLIQAAGPEIQVLLSDLVTKHVSAGPVARPEQTAMLGVQADVRPIRATRNLLYELSRESPVLLILDDLHWADPPSLELIHHLALSIREIPVLLVGAYREVELERTHPLSRLLMDLNRERLLVRERLRRLTLAETNELLTELLGGDVPEGLAEIIHNQTEGNPFFVEELITGLLEDDRLIWNDEESRYAIAGGEIDRLTGQIPQGIRAAIGARLDRLTSDAQDVLSLASVIGREFSLEILNALAASHGFDDETVERALGEAQSARFVTPTTRSAAAGQEVSGFTAGGAEIEADYAFDHALIHQVVYREVDRRRRRRLHAEVGRALEALYEGREGLYAERLAYHYLESDDDAKALEFSRGAGDKMLWAYYDADLALGYYLPALEIVIAREVSLRHLRAHAPISVKRSGVHRYTPEEREAVVAYLGDILQSVPDTPAAKAVAQLASRICIVAMHTGAVYRASLELHERTLLGPDAEKLVVPTARGNLVGILEFPGPGGRYPVVLMFHGSLSSKEVLEGEARRYLSRGLATLRVDLPGFGETTVPVTASPADAEILREMITPVLAHERIDHRGVGLIGYSLSPWHCAQLCARDERVRAMVGISGLYNPHENVGQGVQISEAAFREWARARWQAGARPSPDPLPWSPDASVYDIAHKIRCPMLLVYGALEPEMYRVQSEKLASLVPTARTQVWRSGVHVLRNIPEAHESAAQWMKEQLLSTEGRS